MQSKTTKQILIDARALIAAKNGWMRGELKDGNCYCAVGAIAAARGIDFDDLDMHDADYDVLIYDNRHPAFFALADEIPHFLRRYNDLYPASELWNWNDDHRRRQEDVVALFDRAIAKVLE